MKRALAKRDSLTYAKPYDGLVSLRICFLLEVRVKYSFVYDIIALTLSEVNPKDSA